MKPLSPARVTARLDRSIAWRKKELTQQKFLADGAISGNADVLRRAGIALLYAHWEGFIKDASLLYLRYLSGMPLELANVRSCFAAIGLRGDIRAAGQAMRTSVHAILVERFRQIETPPLPRTRIPWRGVISTHSNLKSAVLREITATLGLDYTPFALKEHTVIDRLVRFRNAIAHGRGQAVPKAEYDTLHSETIALLDIYRDLIEDAVANNRHIK